MIIIRLLLFPIIATFLMILAFAHAIVWVFDNTYDHDAASSAGSETAKWINASVFFPRRARAKSTT